MLRLPVSLVAIASAAILCTVSIDSAAADCSVSDKSSLLSCASNSVLACRNLFPTCREPGQAVSVQDVLSATSTRCCAITGRNKVARQRLCIAAVEQRYVQSQRGADRTVKGFLRETKRQLTFLRKAGCSTGSN
jgi:hypothetical protein